MQFFLARPLHDTRDRRNITTSDRTLTDVLRTLIRQDKGTCMNEALTNAELAVMELLWESDRLTAREIREKLYPDAAKAQHGTVQRLLQSLEDKGYVERDRTLCIHFFWAAVSRETYAGLQVEALADKLTAGSCAPLITHLIEKKRISPEEIDRIRAKFGQHGNRGEQR